MTLKNSMLHSKCWENILLLVTQPINRIKKTAHPDQIFD